MFLYSVSLWPVLMVRKSNACPEIAQQIYSLMRNHLWEDSVCPPQPRFVFTSSIDISKIIFLIFWIQIIPWNMIFKNTPLLQCFISSLSCWKKSCVHHFLLCFSEGKIMTGWPGQLRKKIKIPLFLNRQKCPSILFVSRALFQPSLRTAIISGYISDTVVWGSCGIMT